LDFCGVLDFLQSASNRTLEGTVRLYHALRLGNRGRTLNRIQISQTELVHILGTIAAVALLNAGLYIVLYVLAPLVAGIIGGYLLGRPGRGLIVGLVGSMVTYTPLLAVLDSFQATASDPLVLLQAALILSAVGAAGGFVGGLLRSRLLVENSK
jgi:membrane associated rhomboid family serine protease